MLVAHLVPGYFAAVISQPHWKPEWGEEQRVALWVAALSSTVVPDLDVIYNALFRGTIGRHSLLWTHSVFPDLGLVLVWWLIRRIGRWPYVQTMIGLVIVGGLSHLALDVVAHSTPLLYPVSMYMFGAPSLHVLSNGLWGYLTDPVFLLEPLLVCLAVAHWTAYHPRATPQLKAMVFLALVGGCVAFSAAFLLLLPTLRRLAAL